MPDNGMTKFQFLKTFQHNPFFESGFYFIASDPQMPDVSFSLSGCIRNPCSQTSTAVNNLFVVYGLRLNMRFFKVANFQLVTTKF